MFSFLKQVGASTWELVLFWLLIGGASMASPWVCGKVISTFRRGFAISLLTLVTLTGAILPLINHSALFIYISATIFGSAFFSVPASTTAFVRRNLNQVDWTFAIGIFTTVFGLGQIVGPFLTGYISDETGKLSDGLLWGCIFLLCGSALSLLQTDLRKDG